MVSFAVVSSVMFGGFVMAYSFGWLPRVLSIRGLVMAGVEGYKAYNRLVLRIRGLTEDDVAHRRIVTGEAWEEFCDTLKAAGSAILGHNSPKDPLTQAEGYRYLSRLTRVALENFLECSDPLNPQLVSLANGSRLCRVCIGSDNPDNLYQNAVIDSRKSYMITGTRGTVDYLGFGIQSGGYGKPGGLRTVCYREASQLHIQDNGEITIFIFPKGSIPPGKLGDGRVVHKSNILISDPEIPEGVFIVRQTFANRKLEIPAKLSISLLGDQEGKGENKMMPAGSINSARLDSGLRSAGLLVAGASTMFARWAKGFREKHCNSLPLFDQKTSDSIGGDPNIRYYHSYWKISKTEALVIDVKPPKCRTWNFQVNNHWMESLDYRFHPIHTNKFLAKYRPDKSVRIIVSHRDPKMADTNWVSTVGHDCGTMCFRFVKPEVSDAALPHPKARLVNYSELSSLGIAR
mmetsp:Transcript_23352/g.36689  ORF Transcript_23352/g.36689 Transcript_23352/m.36689 type:complete len:460 (-) Transcript_23352:64-1443(-)